MRRSRSTLRYLGLAAAPRPTRHTRSHPVSAAPSPKRRPPAAGPGHRQRPPARRPRRPVDHPHPLRWLGLAEQPVRVTGHPRIRERALATLARRRRRDQAVTASIGALLALVLLGLGVVRSPLLAVESLTVIGLDDAQQQAVADAVSVTAGTNVMDVDLPAVKADVEQLPWVSRAVVGRRLPSGVEIRVATRTPVAVAVLDDGRWLLDADGLVLERVTDSDPVATTRPVEELPVIQVLRAPEVGRVVDEPSVRSAAAVAADMPRALDEWIIGYATTGGGEVDATLRIATDDGPADLIARLGRPEGIAAKAATLAALLEETIGRGIRPTVLDVRIPDRPVVHG